VTEPVRDLAHLPHVELLTPKPDASLFYFTEILGMEVAGEKGQAWGMQTVASFHIKGTPPVPEEDVLLADAGH
jgi:catechol 2,3-dioxygenase